ncbi:MAG: asparagine synthase (glutamine-hydrolyzing) [Bacteroidetes bacterium]|nr:asparagine synthase (glutamine-hydrolyzing) [Bacteroidota bacterium]
MCGIAGIISKNEISQDVISAMTQRLKHRGPDAQGIFIDPNKRVALGHTRLSIIDLSDAANQPFLSQNGRYVVIFNGEIYNFKALRGELKNRHGVTMRTNSDTEVIAEGFSIWGEAIASKLEGMFAIAIVDHREQSLFLLRDRIGKKPLFYYKSESEFVFASEIKALLCHPSVRSNKKFNKKVFGTFLHLGYIPEPETAFTNIFKFPAGHYGHLNSNLGLTVKPYWRIEEQLGLPRMNDPIKQLDALLNYSVESRLISDVPLGAFLSGGTDSSLITAYASKFVSQPLKTFSIGFKESKFDESVYSEAVAKHLNTDHTQYQLSENEAIRLLETYLDHFDEPFADASAIPTMLVSGLARKHVKVALTGDGGDELFLGYGSYRWADRLNSVGWRLIRHPLLFSFKHFGNSRLKRVSQLLEPARKGSIRSHIFSQEQYFFSDHEIENKLLRDTLDYESFRYADPAGLASSLSEEEKQAIFDLKFYLKDDLLVKTDRASMFHGLECRCPLLDHSIIDFALNTPFEMKRRGGVNKWILKELLKTYLPADLVNRPKWGFSIPLSQWMKNELSYLMDFLSEENLEKTAIFKTPYVRDLVDRFHKGEEYLYNRLWVVIIMQRFLINHV